METKHEQQPKVDKEALELAKRKKAQQIKQQSIVKKDENNNPQ